MTEPLSSERVDEIRRWWTGPANTLPEFVAGDVLALCDTVESLRAAIDDLLREQNEYRKDVKEQGAEMETLRTERDELSRLLVGGAVDVDELVASLRARQAERVELETLRGIAKRIADGWRAEDYRYAGSPARWVWGAEFHKHIEPMTPAEVHAIWPEESDSNEESSP